MDFAAAVSSVEIQTHRGPSRQSVNQLGLMFPTHFMYRCAENKDKTRAMAETTYFIREVSSLCVFYFV